MAAHSRRPAETVRKVAELALGDAVEITLLIALMRGQNADGVNKQLDAAGAGRAAGVIRNALMARLVLLIARAYSEPKHGDLHLRACLLKDNTTRQYLREQQWLREACCLCCTLVQVPRRSSAAADQSFSR